MALDVQPADTYLQAMHSAAADGEVSEVANLAHSAAANLTTEQTAALLFALCMGLHEVTVALALALGETE